jgi:colicin import membrane protein
MATVTTTSVHGVPYTIPPEPNRTPSILIALMVHAGLLGFLWVGIRWQNVEPVSVEAEVWDMKTESAAPPPPRPEPVRPPELTPVPKVAPPPPPPPKAVEPVAPKAPDIALEREKEKKKLLEKRLAEEKVAKEKARQLAELEAKEKALDEKKNKELADKKAADKAKADKLAKAAKDLAEEKQAQKMRDLEMKRMMGKLDGSGSADKSTAPRIDTGYVAAVTSKIKRSTSYNGDTDVPGNPKATFKIEQLPTGEIISVRKMKSSGIAAFDDAVERGINNSSPLPKKKDGTVERSIEVSILMKELN